MSTSVLVPRLARRLAQLRKEKHLTQEELAKLLQQRKGTISVWERGTRKPRVENLWKLSRVFNVSLDYILGESDERGEAVAVREEVFSDASVSEARASSTGDRSKSTLKTLRSALDLPVRKLAQLSMKSQAMIFAAINAAFRMELSEGNLYPEGERIGVVVEDG